MTESNWQYQDKVTVACANFHPVTRDRAAALNKIKDFTVRAARQGANIILFPEIALGNIHVPRGKLPVQPPPEFVNLAETIPGPATEAMASTASRHNIYVIFGMIERQGDRYYNAAAVIGPSGILGVHRKIHFRAPWETAWLSSGYDIPLFITPYGPFGVGICYETYFIPEVTRTCAVRGARLFLNLTASPDFPEFPDCREFYVNMLGCRSLENQLFVASANTVGKQAGLNLFGQSLIVGPRPGYMNYHLFAGPASDKAEEIVMAQLDLRSLDNLPFPMVHSLLDRQPHLYHYLTEP